MKKSPESPAMMNVKWTKSEVDMSAKLPEASNDLVDLTVDSVSSSDLNDSDKSSDDGSIMDKSVSGSA